MNSLFNLTSKLTYEGQRTERNKHWIIFLPTTKFRL